MMEFTLSRVVLGICGIVLLAAVMPPVNGIYDDRESFGYQEQTDRIALLFDSFYESEADTMTISFNDILPSSDSYIEIDGHLITLHTDGRTFLSAIDRQILSENTLSYGHNDVAMFMKSGDGVVVHEECNGHFEKAHTILLTAVTNLSMSLSSL